jgi:hypothetical protein
VKFARAHQDLHIAVPLAVSHQRQARVVPVVRLRAIAWVHDELRVTWNDTVRKGAGLS